MPDHVIAQQETRVNGVRMAYLEAGQGPLAVLVHGFPDDAWTWSEQLPALADAGYRVVAPFLRGYPPSDVPAPGGADGCNSKNNAADLEAFLRAVGATAERPARLVGHDWGGLAVYGVISAAPELVQRAAVVAVSHPATLLPILERPPLLHHLFHVWFFNVEQFCDASLRANDFALVDYLWDYWTVDGHDDTAHVKRLKQDVFGRPGVVEALTAYYRALVRLPQDEPEFVARLLEPTPVPMLSVWGGSDPAREAATAEREFFVGEYEHVVLDGAGHFVHREQPGRFNQTLLDWLQP